MQFTPIYKQLKNAAVHKFDRIDAKKEINEICNELHLLPSNQTKERINEWEPSATSANSLNINDKKRKAPQKVEQKLSKKLNL